MKKYKASIFTAVVIFGILLFAWFLDSSLEINTLQALGDNYLSSQVFSEEINIFTALYYEVDEDYLNEFIDYEQYILKQEENIEENYIAYQNQENQENYISRSGDDQGLQFPYSEDLILENSGNSEELFEEIIEKIIEIEEDVYSYIDLDILEDGSFFVTLSVQVHMILHNMHLLNANKHELVPEDGFIFPPTEVVVYEGESVFDVLQREMRANNIHMVSRWTPIFNSAYVEAINNLFEFDVGPLSGWMYSVNGWFPNFGSSIYILSSGDVIEWHYTVDLGRDLGVYWVED